MTANPAGGRRSAVQLLLPIEEVVEDFPQCEAFWHPRRCLLPAQHPQAKRTDGFWTMGHFFPDTSPFSDWAEVHPWNAAWSDVHEAFYWTARREMEAEYALACIAEWAGGPPAPPTYAEAYDPQCFVDPEAVEERTRERLKIAEKASGGLGKLPRWNW